MELILHDGKWSVNDYIITGNKEDGYDIYEEFEYMVKSRYDSENLSPVASYDNFEEALVWVMNS